jgi:hypothetical protein
MWMCTGCRFEYGLKVVDMDMDVLMKIWMC